MKSSPFNRILDILVPFGVFLRDVEHKKPFVQWQRLVLQVIPFTFFVFWLFSFIPFIGTPLIGDIILPTVFLALLFSVLKAGLHKLDF